MLTQREKTLLNYLKRRTAPVSCQNIALHCGCSVNTIRKEISLLNSELYGKGCAIEAAKSQGYRLAVSDLQKAEAFFSENGLAQTAALTNQDFNTDSRYRPYFIIRCLLTSPRPVSLVELTGRLYCSKSTLLRSLKTCEEYCALFSLQLKNIRNRGLTITGNEYHKRICLIYQLKAFRRLEDRLQEREERFLYTFRLSDQSLYQQLRSLVLDCIQGFPEYQLAFLHIPKIVHYLTLCVTRGPYTESISFSPEQFDLISGSGVHALSRSIFRKLETCLRQNFPEAAALSLTPLLLACRSLSSLSQISDPAARSLQQEAEEACAVLYQKFRLACLVRPETAGKLACHLYASQYRRAFCIPEDFEKQALVRNEASYILDFCLELASYLEKRQSIRLDRGEIFSFYYLFSSALHQDLCQIYPLHILCISKYGVEYAEHTARRLLKIYQNSHLNLDTYIHTADVCEFSSIATLRYKNYDLLVTDIPAPFFRCDYPIAEIDMQRDLVKSAPLKNALARIADRHYRPYISPRAVITSFRSKEDAFRGIAGFLQKETGLCGEELAAQLRERDSRIGSERSRHLALLGASRPFLSGGRIVLFLNRHPIPWEDEQCQIFLFYHYGTEPVPVILALEFLLSRLRKADPTQISRLIETPSADLIDFLNAV